MSKGPTWNDLKEATSADLKRVYKLNDRQLEVSVRKHMDGTTNDVQRRAFYESVYSSKGKS
jgi:hypothetical protein